MRYRPDIDGLRAIAICTVLLYHFGLGAVSGGFVGVDVFFVISGFLITSIIHRELEAGKFSLVRFYERRCRRILPPLFVVIAVSLVTGFLLMMPADFDALAKSAAAALLFVSNIWFWRYGGDYFARTVETQPLLHTWSLAVEEQFYLIFPLLFLLVHRLWPRRIPAAIIAITVLSLMLAVAVTDRRPVAAFYFSPARFWELGTGCILALGVIKPPPAGRSREVLAFFALLLIVVPVVAYDSQTTFPGLGAVPPVLGTALLILVNGGKLTAVGKALASPAPVWVGKISYSLYLWHWPLIAFAAYVSAGAEIGFETRAILLLVTFVLAAWSWRFVERPFRTPRFMQLQVFGLSASAAASLGCVAILIVANAGLPQRLSASELALANYVDARDPEARKCIDGVLAGQVCVVGAGGAPQLALWGDSHADAIAPAVRQAAAAQGASLALLTNAGCAPLLGLERKDVPRCREANEASLRYIIDRAHIRTVVLAARWAYWQSGHLPFSDRQPLRVEATDGSRAEFETALARTVAELRRAGKKVVLIGGIPELPWAVPDAMFVKEHLGVAVPPSLSIDDVRSRNAEVDRLFGRLARGNHVKVFDAARLLCSPTCATVLAGEPAYRDSDHLTPVAAEKLLAIELSKMLRTNIEEAGSHRSAD